MTSHMFELQGISVIGVQQIDRVTEVVEETLKGKYIIDLYYRKFNHSNLLSQP